VEAFMIIRQQSQTAGSIQYDVFSRSSLANYLSDITPKRDSVIDIVKNSTIVFPSYLNPKPDTVDTSQDEKQTAKRA
jgi:hypothetical protein